MTKRSFHVQAVWDDSEKLWFSKSDIRGLHLEAETLEEFYGLVEEFASELIVTNHYSDVEFSGKDMRELIPAILISQPDGPTKAA